MSDVTRILTAIDQGDPKAAGQLLPLVYAELRRLAAQRLAHEKPGQTLQPTALVHEAYLRLVGSSGGEWNGRNHFFAAAAEAMRRILVENARRKQRMRHGGGRRRVDLPPESLAEASPTEAAETQHLLALDQALARLAEEDPQKAQVVKLRYFAGLTIAQTAAALGISHATVERLWAYARAWLLKAIAEGPNDTS